MTQACGGLAFAAAGLFFTTRPATIAHEALARSRLTLDSFDRPGRALVVGASGGIGSALFNALDGAGFVTCGTSRQGGEPLSTLDVLDESSIVDLCARLRPDPPLRIVFVASGLLHDTRHQPEKSWRALDAEQLARSFAVNAIGPALVAKHVLPLLPRGGKSVFAIISARVGSIEDNRLGGWYGYRASKAAVNQIVRTLAIEARCTRPDAIVLAVHPGTVETKLSAPFRSQVADDALFTPPVAARHLLDVVDGLTSKESGGFFAWDGASIPF